jgi:hypothetical protein
METSTPPAPTTLPDGPITGPQRLALWQAAQKLLQGKLHPQDVQTMRDEWVILLRTERV